MAKDSARELQRREANGAPTCLFDRSAPQRSRLVAAGRARIHLAEKSMFEPLRPRVLEECLNRSLVLMIGVQRPIEHAGQSGEVAADTELAVLVPTSFEFGVGDPDA
jgi:hypothetical protein